MHDIFCTVNASIGDERRGNVNTDFKEFLKRVYQALADGPGVDGSSHGPEGDGTATVFWPPAA